MSFRTPFHKLNEHQQMLVRLRQAQRAWGRQTDLSDATGIPYGTLQKYFQGKSDPGLSDLSKIAAVLNVSIVWLVSGTHRHSEPRDEPSPTLTAMRLQERAGQLLSQDKLAHAAGLPIGTVQSILQGRGDPGIHKVAKLAQVLGVSLDDLVFGRSDFKGHTAPENLKPCQPPREVQQGAGQAAQRLSAQVEAATDRDAPRPVLLRRIAARLGHALISFSTKAAG